MERLERAVKHHTHRLMTLPNVVGIGQGQKTVRGVATGEEALVVLVEKKVPEKDLARGERIPRALGQVAVDVLEVGELRLLGARTEYQRPACPGVSIGHYKVSAGTFGAVVRDRNSGNPLILSNNHVLANATDGRDGRAVIGDPVFQPGSHDGGTKEQIIGYLERFIPLMKEFSSSECKVASMAENLGNRALQYIRRNYRLRLEKKQAAGNTVDAALARPVSLEAIDSEIVGLGRVQGLAEARAGMQVKKSGRTSGVSSAVIQVVLATVKVTVTDKDKGIFNDQFVTSVMSQPGDSGSLVVDEALNAVGLLFAGSSSTTVCNRIQNVLSALNIMF